MEIPRADELAQVRLLTPGLLDRPYRREYTQMARAILRVSGPEIAEEWFALISRHPEMSDQDVRKMTAFFEGKEIADVTDEDVTVWRNNRLRELLMLVEDALPQRLVGILAGLDAQLGERPKHPDFSVWVESFVGPTAPVTEAELSALEPEQVIALLHQWEPEPGPVLGPSREGLGRALTRVVKDDPSKFDAVIAEIIRLRPTFVRAFLSAWAAAVKEGRAIDWGIALTVVDFVSKRADEGNLQPSGDDDPGWRWSHQEAVRLLQGGLIAGAELGPAPVHAERILVALTRFFCESPDPTPDRDDQSFTDPMTASLNAVRSSAFSALIAYLDWCERASLVTYGGPPNDVAPRVFEILDRHLDPTTDSSPAVRSVYGQDFPFLARVSPDWAEANADRVLGVGGGTDSDQRLRDVGWLSFVYMRQPSRSLLELLGPIYRARLTSPDASNPGVNATQTLASRVGEHVLLLYGGGDIGIDTEDGLVRAFFTQSDAETRAAVMGRIGWHLERWATPQPEVVSRLQQLWEWRKGEMKDTPDRVELGGFGWWFRSGKFPRDWAIEQLAMAAGLGTRFDVEGLVAEELGTYAKEFPGQALVIMRSLLTDKDPMEASWIGRQAAPIIVGCLSSGNAVLIARARALEDDLGTAGMNNIRDEVAHLMSTE